MHPATLAMMREHVRAIHRTLVGADPPMSPEEPPAEATPSVAEVARRFAELEAACRALPALTARVPPFSFAPPFDLVSTERELIVEVGLPGVERGDLEATVDSGFLIVSGARGVEAPDGQVYLHAELPRGPFRRTIPLPFPTSGIPRIELDRGLVRIRLTRAQKSPLARA